MTFGAAYVRGLTGFGMAIILVPLLGLIIPPAQAVVLGILLQLLIGPVGLGLIHADADRATALPIGLIAMATTPIGMAVLGVTRPDVARLLITAVAVRSEEHTSELQSLMRISYAVFCLKKKNTTKNKHDRP